MGGDMSASNSGAFSERFLSAVVGQRVDAIGFPYQTSYSICLGNGAGFTIHSKSMLSDATGSYVTFETGFRSRLCEVLGETIQQMYNRGEEYELSFSNGTHLVISDRGEDFDGPEGGVFTYEDLLIVFTGV